MRIIAGRFRGRALTPLGKGDAGAHLRPTPDRVRESLFSILAARGVLDGARVLDLFAGTGALGLEALSRGADHVTFVENGRTGASLIQRNAKLLGVADSTHLFRMDATKLGANTAQPADLVFLDPPYGKGLGARALTAAENRQRLRPTRINYPEEDGDEGGIDELDAAAAEASA